MLALVAGFVRMTVTSGTRSETMTLWSSDGATRTWQFDELFRAASASPAEPAPVRELLEADEWARLFVSLDPPRLRDLPEDALRRIAAADLSFPLIKVEEIGLVDGFHRLAKAHLAGIRKVSVVSLSFF